jgi:poly(A) polymerase
MITHARLFDALGAPGVDARYVGGVVRNHLMGESLNDIDIATPDVPARVMERLEAAGIKVIPTGIDHGTVTAVADGVTYEITTLRRDTACDGRHAAVEFTTDWEEDARRRDFTINAMSLRPDGALFDYHGGEADVLAGRVRFVGDPADRIQEDYLRILRLFRFQARYGLEDIDTATLKAVRDHAAGLAKLSAERIAQELAKLLGAPNPAPTVALMSATGVLADILPEALPGPHLMQLIAHEAETLMPNDWLRRLAVLLPADVADTLARRRKLSNADAARLKVMTATHPVLTARIAHIDLDRALYRLGQTAVTDRLLIAWSRDATVNDDRWRAQLARAAFWQEKTLPVSGADVLALGLAPSPQVGELLRAVEEWWIASGFVPTREEALAYLKAEAKSS